MDNKVIPLDFSSIPAIPVLTPKEIAKKRYENHVYGMPRNYSFIEETKSNLVLKDDVLKAPLEKGLMGWTVTELKNDNLRKLKENKFHITFTDRGVEVRYDRKQFFVIAYTNEYYKTLVLGGSYNGKFYVPDIKLHDDIRLHIIRILVLQYRIGSEE